MQDENEIATFGIKWARWDTGEFIDAYYLLLFISTARHSCRMNR